MKVTIDTKAKTVVIHGSFTYGEFTEEFGGIQDDYTFSLEPVIVKEKEYVPYYPYTYPQPLTLPYTPNWYFSSGTSIGTGVGNVTSSNGQTKLEFDN